MMIGGGGGRIPTKDCSHKAEKHDLCPNKPLGLLNPKLGSPSLLPFLGGPRFLVK